MKTDALGDRVKAYEGLANERSFFRPGVSLVQDWEWVVARVDGRTFSTFTKGMQKPVDSWILEAMIQATAGTFTKMRPRLAYVQSDEATFCWHRDKLEFNMREQKNVSLLSATFTGRFLDTLMRTDPTRYLELNEPPAFDCRMWEVPTELDVLDAFTWREKDAVKNAVSTAARVVAPERELHGISMQDRRELLKERGFDWESLPPTYTNGAYLRHVSFLKPLDEEVRQRIPLAKRPAAGEPVTRHEVRVDTQWLSIHQLDNVAEFFNGGEPKLRPL
jgi:tRNA(His) 5'-end guanylyltransferase